jgi:hypothetical protein
MWRKIAEMYLWVAALAFAAGERGMAEYYVELGERTLLPDRSA